MQRVLSGIRPSGKIHIANYLGALRNWVDLALEHDAIFMVADYHAFDSLEDEKNFLKDIYDTTRWILAVGIKPERSLIFRQSQVPEHAELAWILSSLTPVGELERMTQYKEKSQGLSSVPASLLMYPVLMAADVLAYKASLVPVGDDQLQHLELVRTIARKFNSRFGNTFPQPKGILSKTPRLISLKDPTKKMSKTGDEGIALADSPQEIRRKIMAAVTATEAGKKDMPAGVQNLFVLLENFAPDDVKDFRKKYDQGSLQYADLKGHLAEKIIAHLEPLQKHFKQITDHRVEEALDHGRHKAQAIARATLHEVKEKIGLI